MKATNKIFESEKPIIAMLHVGCLLGTKEYQDIKDLAKSIKRDIEALQKNGVNGMLIENWQEDSVGEFVAPETAVSLTYVINEIVENIKVPFGINVLNNDYKVALSLAKIFNADFVQLDVFVDDVQSDFVHSPIASKNPFEIKTDPKAIHDYADKIGAQGIPIFSFIQPKHYKMLDPNKSIETSARQAVKAGASALLITKATGSAPTIDLIKRAKSAAGNTPVGIGSGFSVENASEFIPFVDFAVVGTSIKNDGNTDNPVDGRRVKALMYEVKKLRKNSQ